MAYLDPEKRRATEKRWKRNNKTKIREYNRRWLLKHPERRKQLNTEAQLRKYGLSRADFDRMFRECGGLCAICLRPETARHRGTLRSLCVDHDHATGRVRGLLCCSCNRAIGYLGDDPLRARALSAYLEMR